MKYKLIQRANPQNRAESRWYASPVNNGKVTQKNIVAEIVKLSSLSRGDVANVIENMLDTVPEHLLMGKSVNLGNLGIMRLSFKSEGAATPEQFNPKSISNIKVVFTPSVEFKDRLDKIFFEKSE